MKCFKYVFGLLIVASSSVIFAHPGGHGEPELAADCKNLVQCTQEEVTRGGLGVIAKFVGNGKLDKSWADIKAADSAKEQEGSWIISYKNPKEPDKTRQTLYIFISEDGVLEGLSHTAQY